MKQNALICAAVDPCFNVKLILGYWSGHVFLAPRSVLCLAQ